MTQRLLPVSEAMTYVGLSRSFLYGLMESGRLPYVKLGRRRLIRLEDLDRLIDASVVSNKPAGRPA